VADASVGTIHLRYMNGFLEDAVSGMNVATSSML
jgi:hypothetical protein